MSFYLFFFLTTTSFGCLLHPFPGQAPGHGPSLAFYLLCNCCWHRALLTPSCTVSDHHSIPQANLSVNCLKLHCPKSSKYTCCSFQKACRPLFEIHGQISLLGVGWGGKHHPRLAKHCFLDDQQPFFIFTHAPSVLWVANEESNLSFKWKHFPDFILPFLVGVEEDRVLHSPG